MPRPATPGRAESNSEPRPVASDGSKIAPQRQRKSTGELLATLSTQITTLIRGEVELTKAKAKGFLRDAGVGGGLLAAAGVLGLYVLFQLLHTAEVALRLVVADWLAALIVAGAVLVVVIIFALIGLSQLKKTKVNVPNPKAGLKKSADAFKKGLGK